MSAEVAAPAHAHGSEDRNIMCRDRTRFRKLFDDSGCCTGGTERRNGDSYCIGGGKPEQRLQNELDCIRCAGEQRNAFVSRARVHTAFGGTFCEHHNDGADNKHAGNDAESDVNAALAAVECSSQNAHAETLFFANTA